MERETLLTLLLVLFGGLALQPLAALRSWPTRENVARTRESRAWLRLWLPVIPTLVIAAWLCGWALRAPDPVRLPLGRTVIVMACAPFALVALRALLRAIGVLLRGPTDLPVCTVGLLRPRIIFSPFLARNLETRLLRAAWEHELAHARHHDPLRIWLAQIATDLQWPWPSAAKRFAVWLETLEWARDDEARSRGVAGTDLASAVVMVARYGASTTMRNGAARWEASPDAALTGAGAQSLEARISRLLLPLANEAGIPSAWYGGIAAATILVGIALAACALGVVDGSAILSPFFAWTWAV
ncbi:MAG: hypothetical protein EPN41_15630 [Candidimonas sp.]|nr:MAG: hypothetical protein EPN41_15630 [Candidimonas sp.]